MKSTFLKRVHTHAQFRTAPKLVDRIVHGNLPVHTIPVHHLYESQGVDLFTAVDLPHTYDERMRTSQVRHGMPLVPISNPDPKNDIALFVSLALKKRGYNYARHELIFSGTNIIVLREWKTPSRPQASRPSAATVSGERARTGRLCQHCGTGPQERIGGQQKQLRRWSPSTSKCLPPSLALCLQKRCLPTCQIRQRTGPFSYKRTAVPSEPAST